MTPRATIDGPKVMIINEGACSAATCCRRCLQFQLGPIVGTRTLGCLVGTWRYHAMTAARSRANIAGLDRRTAGLRRRRASDIEVGLAQPCSLAVIRSWRSDELA